MGSSEKNVKLEELATEDAQDRVAEKKVEIGDLAREDSRVSDKIGEQRERVKHAIRDHNDGAAREFTQGLQEAVRELQAIRRKEESVIIQLHHRQTAEDLVALTNNLAEETGHLRTLREKMNLAEAEELFNEFKDHVNHIKAYERLINNWINDDESVQALNEAYADLESEVIAEERERMANERVGDVLTNERVGDVLTNERVGDVLTNERVGDVLTEERERVGDVEDMDMD